jgi:hypothetical protein
VPGLDGQLYELLTATTRLERGLPGLFLLDAAATIHDLHEACALGPVSIG